MADRFLIVSDVDDTMLGDDTALAEFARWLAPRRETVSLVYNSGRSTDSLRRSVADTLLPEPDALIGNVGTQIETFAPQTSIEDWPLSTLAWDVELVQEVLGDVVDLELQPPRFQSAHKVSYFAFNSSEAQLVAWQAALEAAGLQVKVVYSSKRDLDILPAGIDKGTATTFLATMWNMPSDRVIVCGDTGNDLAMFEQGFLGIVVGNALPELTTLESPGVYLASQDFAAGVLEGLRHWFKHIEAKPLSRS